MTEHQLTTAWHEFLRQYDDEFYVERWHCAQLSSTNDIANRQ